MWTLLIIFFMSSFFFFISSYTLKAFLSRQIPYDITYMWSLKYDTNELIYKTETDTDIENRFVVAKEVGWLGLIGSLGLADANYVCRMDKQVPTV